MKWSYPQAAVERAMTIQEVILQAFAKKITWWQAADILGISDRQLRRWRGRYQKFGYEGLLDGRSRHPSQRRVPVEQVEKMYALYRERYFDLNVRHFHEKLVEEHDIHLSYTWVKNALQQAGLVARSRKRRKHRRRRVRCAMPGMLLHIDASEHRWFQDERYYQLLVILDDATSQIYYAQLVEAESTTTVMRALREVIEKHGRFCALYSDRASHFFYTPKAGRAVQKELTQVGRALQQLGIRMIPAYSPQARGRSERSFATWQGRLPQELRLHGLRELETANRWLRSSYVPRFNRRFAVPAAQPGTAFVPLDNQDLDRIFSLVWERTVNRDNTVQFEKLCLQIEAGPWRSTLAGTRVTVHQHLDGEITLYYGPHRVGRYDCRGVPRDHRNTRAGQAVEKTAAAPPWKSPRDSHFPTAPTTAITST
jgi:transposase